MHKTMSWLSLLVGLSILLNACDPISPTTTLLTDTPIPQPTPTPQPTRVPPTESPTLTPYDNYHMCYPDEICLRWFVGLGTGTDPSQIAVQEQVVDEFNDPRRNQVYLLLEVVPHAAGRYVFADEIATDNGPDIVGPVGWLGVNDFHDQWLDLSPYIESQQFDTSIFEPALVKAYQTQAGQVALPFMIFPSGLLFIPEMFDKAGLAYPPQTYGEKYRLPNGVLVNWNWATLELVARLLTLDKTGKNATQAGFDRNQIVQVGYVPQWQSLNSIGTYDGGPSLVYTCNKKGEAQAAIPDTWKQAWQKHYDAMLGDRPWMPSGPLANLPDFGGGNVFNSGKAAMALVPLWYLCCMEDLIKAGQEFQVGIIPMSAEGVVHGRVDGDTFRIWKGTDDPTEAFQVLTYLLTTGSDKLLPPYYDHAMPAIISKREAFFTRKSQEYPFVTQASWEVFQAGVAYPDIPSADAYMPNLVASAARLTAFSELLDNTPPDQFDFETEFHKLEDDLTVIFKEGSC